MDFSRVERAADVAAAPPPNMADRSPATVVALAGCSNAIAASFTNPIDVVKTRMQMQGEGLKAGAGPGVSGTARSIVAAEGAAGLYRGLSASLCREMSYSGIRMGMYEPARRSLAGWLGVDPAHTPLYLKVLAGAITGCTGSALANPLDLVKVRMQALPKSGRETYPSVPAALAAIWREGGVGGLWRGTVPTVQRATLLTASQVPAYDHVKHLMLEGGHMREGYLCHFFCSMVAGVVAAAVTSPVDLVKSRMMIQPIDEAGRGTLYATTTDCFKTVVRTEGGLALFKGFNSQWLRIGPHTTVSLMVFEQLRKRMGMDYL